jgi:RNA polymerase sigma-70 factor (ECF subfamily)
MAAAGRTPDPIGEANRADADRLAEGRLSDDALVAAVAAGDDGALSVLYDRHGRIAFSLAYRLLGERGAAEDATQEAFLSLWRHAGRFRPERGAVRSWLLTIVHHAAIDRRRGRHRWEAGAMPLDDIAFSLTAGDGDTFAAVAADLTAGRIRDAVAGLPDEQREAIELAYFGGLSHGEIAERTSVPLGTVKGRMRLGLSKLRSALIDEAPLGATEGGR